MQDRSRTWRILLGSSLLVVGIAGLGLPFLQGIALIVLAILILAKDIPYFDRLARRLKIKRPSTPEAV